MVVPVDQYRLEKLDLLLLKNNNIYNINNIYLAKAIICYFFNNYNAAWENLQLISKFERSLQGTILFVEYKFYFALTLLGLYSPENHQLLKILDLPQKQIKVWADNAPENYQHKYELLEAEKAQVMGEEAKAMELYDRAIRGARRNGYLQEEALANELAAKFYLTIKCDTIAQIYMTEAYSKYLRWGAKAKAKDLAAKYPRLIAHQKAKQVHRLNINNPALTLTHRSNQLFDFSEISKAVLALSGEMVLSNLLDKLMKTLIENVGAQTGLFLVKFKNRWMIAAGRNSDGEEIKITQSPDSLLFPDTDDIDSPAATVDSDRPSETDLPHALLNYVERTSDNLVLDDAENAGIFAFDPYIATHQPKSILCLPVIQRDKLIGILYLENNLVRGAFSSKRLPVLNLLISQVAISLENAHSYTALQQELKQLQMKSQALEIQCQQLRSPNLPLPPPN
jgi:GAF domain-containing protein